MLKISLNYVKKGATDFPNLNLGVNAHMLKIFLKQLKMSNIFPPSCSTYDYECPPSSSTCESSTYILPSSVLPVNIPLILPSSTLPVNIALILPPSNPMAIVCTEVILSLTLVQVTA